MICFPQISAMREVAPVIWSNSAQAWIVTRHEDLVLAYSGKLPLSNVRYAAPFSAFTKEEREQRFPVLMATLPFWPVFTDPPQHVRLRKLLMRAFGKKTVDLTRPVVAQNVAKILDRAGEKGEIEFVDDVARAITARTILHLLGMSEDHIAKLQHWSLVMNTALGAVAPSAEVMDELERNVIEMGDIFRAEIDKRRTQPGDDFISQMVLSRDGSDALSDEEIVGVCYVVLIAGHDTTMNSMGLATIALARDPDAVDYMIDHPQDITNSVMEISRYISMSTVQPRIVSEDFEWHGEQLKKDQVVFLTIGGANRDPRVFANPEVLDLTRDASPALVFGTGIHHCIGHLLAKMQLSEFLPALFSRYDVEVLDYEFAPSLAQRGPAELHCKLTTRKPASTH